MTTVDRVIPFSTVFNFRDLGGYPAAAGSTVRWSRLYRSDGLHRLTPVDFEDFAALGVRTVLDLRRPDELEADGRVAESLGLAYHNLNFHADLWPQFTLGAALPRYLADRYAEMAEGGLTGRNAVAASLRLIADSDSTPLVFHCAAGKDRTGVLAALTLSLLGVADDDIAADYALSAESERRFREWRRSLAADRPEEDGHSPWQVDPCPRDAMHLFLVELRERHGSVEGYARRAGITDAQIERLREHMLD
ncbi:tyrosine-protein phosphatase [Planosporangium thailandense]|uniref:tyrosine-protein phosphatase n=1 Tax=Planosporangium thailandense TaxID=765197 RepID=UPI0030B80871